MLLSKEVGGLKVTGWTKLFVVIAVIVSATFLGAEKLIEGQAVVALLSAALGYVFGNGHGIISAQEAHLTNKEAQK